MLKYCHSPLARQISSLNLGCSRVILCKGLIWFLGLVPMAVLETGSSLGISLWGSSCNYKIRSLFFKGACNNSICGVLLEECGRKLSFKLLHRITQLKCFWKKFKSDIGTSFYFFVVTLWNWYGYLLGLSSQFWTEFSNVISCNVLQGFSLLFKDVLFGFLIYKR